MSIGKNIAANITSAAVVGLAPMVVLPILVAQLGAKQWGLLGFITTLHVLMGLLDAGASQALLREISTRLGGAAELRTEAGVLLVSLERLYLAFAGLASLALLLLTPLAVAHWLELEGPEAAQAGGALRVAALLFLVLFPGFLYRTVLVAGERQVELSVVTIVATLLRQAGGVAVVLAYPSLLAYLYWQCAVTLGETLVRWRLAWAAVGITRATAARSTRRVEEVVREVGRMSTAVLLGVITIQLDRIVISRMLPIEQLGYYTIAFSVAGSALQAVYPVMQAVFPAMARLRDDAPMLRRMNLRLLLVMLAGIAVGATLFALVGRPLLERWLRNVEVARTIYPILTLLLVGSALQAIYNIGYQNWLVYGRTWRVLQVNLASLVACLVVLPLSIRRFGLIGACVGWLVTSSLGALLSLECFRKRAAT